MTRAEVQAHVVQALAAVAPEVDAAAIGVDAPLRDQVDLDSIDFLRFVVELHRRLGVDVPEADYPHLTSIRSVTDYCESRRPAGS